MGRKGQLLAFGKRERDESCDSPRVIRSGGLNTWDTVFPRICQEVVSDNEPIPKMRKRAQIRAEKKNSQDLSVVLPKMSSLLSADACTIRFSEYASICA